MLQTSDVKKLAVGLFLITSNFAFSQTNSDLFTSVSEDSLQKIFLKINEASTTDLLKVHESFNYRNRVAPSDQNKRILEYVQYSQTVFVEFQ